MDFDYWYRGIISIRKRKRYPVRVLPCPWHEFGFARHRHGCGFLQQSEEREWRGGEKVPKSNGQFWASLIKFRDEEEKLYIVKNNPSKSESVWRQADSLLPENEKVLD